MTSLLGGVGNSPNLRGRLKPQPQSPAGDRASGRALGVGLRYRKWLWWLKPIEGERENGRGNREPAAARSPPTVRLPAGSAPRVALPPAACRSRGFCLRPSCHPAASPPGEGSTTETRERKGQGRGTGRSSRSERKSGVCVSGEGRVGEIMSVQPRGCVFYLFI